MLIFRMATINEYKFNRPQGESMRREIGGAIRYVKYSELRENEVIVKGKYIRSAPGNFGVQHEFMEETGQRVILNSSGALDKKLEYCEIGNAYEVVYYGLGMITKGPYAGKNFHDIRVFDVSGEIESQEKATSPEEIGL